MKPSVWVGYPLGRADAIRELADNRATIWMGIGLVLLTSIARNYDQTFIGEKPFLWLFGSLLFSLVSGTWLYLILYGWFVRRATADADGKKPGFWSRWICFMGLFWMTAPVAWLYAIPVERFFVSLTAAKANLILLAIVSLWRVILIARVVQCLTGARYYAVLLWVLFAAGVEILVVFFFGGAFARAIMAGMGGMMNSPEETLIVNSLATVFMAAFWGTPIILFLALVLGRNQSAEDFPAMRESKWGGRWLLFAALLWVGVAVMPQVELSRNVKVDELMAAQKYQEAIDYMSTRRASDFAPARVLSPNAFEWEIFEELPACFGAVETNTPAWLRAHLIRRLDEMVSHYGPRWAHRKLLAMYPREEQINHVADGVKSYGPKAGAMLELLNGLERIPEGREWLKTNTALLEGVMRACVQISSKSPGADEAETRAAWLALETRLNGMGVANTGITNVPDL